MKEFFSKNFAYVIFLFKNEAGLNFEHYIFCREPLKAWNVLEEFYDFFSSSPEKLVNFYDCLDTRELLKGKRREEKLEK